MEKYVYFCIVLLLWLFKMETILFLGNIYLRWWDHRSQVCSDEDAVDTWKFLLGSCHHFDSCSLDRNYIVTTNQRPSDGDLWKTRWIDRWRMVLKFLYHLKNITRLKTPGKPHNLKVICMGKQTSCEPAECFERSEKKLSVGGADKSRVSVNKKFYLGTILFSFRSRFCSHPYVITPQGT